MRESLNVWLITRQGFISESIQVYDYEIDRDYITSNKSSFRILEHLEFQQGDFLLAKFPRGASSAYFGVINSYENDMVICNDIFSLVNFEFAATRKSGNSFEEHAKTLITKFLINDPSKLMSILDIEVLTHTSHIYQPSESPTVTNLMRYLINGFKKYNVVWDFKLFNNRIQTTLENVTETIQIKDNLYDVVNWDVSTTEVGKGVENHLVIIDKKTIDSENPKVLSEWYLTTENEVTQNMNDEKVIKPTKTKIWIYDTTEEEKPTYEDVAKSELSGSYYSHEISCDVRKSSKIIDVTKLKIGTLANIHHKDKVYQSVLTGYTLITNSEFVQLRFGHIRSRLSELLE